MGSSDTHAWKLLATRARYLKGDFEREGKTIVRDGAEGFCAAVKRDMPVRTGRAKAGWGRYTPEDLMIPNADSRPSDAVWVISEKGWSIRQGTNVPYTEYLNAGHSQQAPAGFIDRNLAFAVEDMRHRMRGLRSLVRALAGR